MIPTNNKNQLFYGVEFDQDTFYEICDVKNIKFDDPLGSFKEDFKKYLDLTGDYDFLTLLDNGNVFFGYPVNLGCMGDNPVDLIADVCYAISSFDTLICFRFKTTVASTFDCFNPEYRMFKIL